MYAGKWAYSLSRKSDVTMDSIVDLRQKLASLTSDKDQYMRAVVFGLGGELRQRIHVKGLKADGSRIGEYKNSYLRIREKENRGRDSKIILSLTRQMEQDFIPVADNDEYGLGFNNDINFDKATWMENKFPNTYNLSEEETEMAEQVITDYLNGLFE